MKMSQMRSLAARRQEIMEHVDDPARLQELARQENLCWDSIYQELEMDDPYVDTHEDPGTSAEHVQLHSHNFYEILYVCSGDLQYLIGSERYRIRRGDVIMIPPGIGHQPLRSESPGIPYRRYVLWASTELMNGLRPLLPTDDLSAPNLLRTTQTTRDAISACFASGIREAEQKKPGWQAALYGNTMELLTLLYRAAADKRTQQLQSERPELLDRILTYVEENLNHAVSLEDISRQFYVSQSTVSNLFRQEMGISFHRCVTQRRLIAAKELISAGEVLESVSAQVGFSDYSAFYRAFKREYGISPRQYRKL